MARSFSSWVCILLAVVPSHAAFSCDEEYGKHCPEEAPGMGLVECLEKAKPHSDSCNKWLTMMKTCEDDVSKFCKGNEADAFVCLTEWTKSVDLSSACVGVLPKKQAEKKGKASKSEEKRAAHKKAMKDLKKRKKAEKRAQEAKDGGIWYALTHMDPVQAGSLALGGFCCVFFCISLLGHLKKMISPPKEE